MANYPPTISHINPALLTLNGLPSIRSLAPPTYRSPTEEYRRVRDILCRDRRSVHAINNAAAKQIIMQKYMVLLSQIDAEIERITVEESAHWIGDSPAYSIEMGIARPPVTRRPSTSRICENTSTPSQSSLPQADIYELTAAGETAINGPDFEENLVARPDQAHLTSEDVSQGLRDLREYRNTYLAIHGLPNFVLEDIFCYTADPHRGSVANFQLGYVCRIWRSAALQCGRLWSHIVASHPGSIAEQTVVNVLLSRSNTASLDVQLFPPDPVPWPLSGIKDENMILGLPSVLQFVLNELPRIRSLNLSLSRKAFAHFAPMFNVQAPLLQVLTLCINADATRADCDTVSLPLPEIAVHVPALRDLRTVGLHTRLAWPLVVGASSTITYLQLRAPHHLQQDALAVDTLFTTLRSLTSLTTLDLGCRVLPASLLVGAGKIQTASCRSLRTLHLSGTMSYLIWFLNHLQFPPFVNVDIAIFAGTANEIAADQYSTFSQHLHTILYPIHSKENALNPLDYASCTWRPNMGFPRINPSILHLMFSDSADPIDDYRSRGERAGFTHTVYHNWEQVETNLDRFRTPISCRSGQRIVSIWMLDTQQYRFERERVESIWGNLPLQDVHTLYLDGVPVADPEHPHSYEVSRTFMNYIVPMSSVNCLVVRGWDPDWLAQLLIPVPEEYPDVDWTSPEPFPFLQSLMLIGNLQEVRSGYDNQLSRVLHGRIASRTLLPQAIRIQELVLRNYIDRDSTLQLRKYVPRCIRNDEVMWEKES